jgi:rubrerythrin
VKSSKYQESILALIGEIDIVISNEHAARRYYRSALKLANSQNTRDLFDWLANRHADKVHSLFMRRKKILEGTELSDKTSSMEMGTAGRRNDVWVTAVSHRATDLDLYKAAVSNESNAYSDYQRKLTSSDNPLIRKFYLGMVVEQENLMRILNERMWHTEVDRAFQGLKARKLASQS